MLFSGPLLTKGDPISLKCFENYVQINANEEEKKATKPPQSLSFPPVFSFLF